MAAGLSGDRTWIYDIHYKSRVITKVADAPFEARHDWLAREEETARAS